ncbi:hypothetical protein M2349_001653 [Caldanaerobacter subterraneus subsp. tengcongensis MB4]|uniref:Uncharacterized protein n=1 Tax=Caldanaerobacter subterraneus subsp. tengcongensis (strain DSM 15242 / JCM 11007 / NBRC 100824 / MB4) TaxID=273068 RepID=Q8RBV1_CALS4|nr:hypothetical protein [Caldanaerobacter subterraneus]AAM23969.1 hypothetical protein TTE0707 [Caldanaerobacter subterraneus subsp. tengcongensis MB4]MCS3916512.1 hypothetical protein [Caldanaerobacter subterraneus subsp. tengcongensis MB4]
MTVEKLEELKEIKKAIEFLQGLKSEPGRVLRPLDGTSFSTYDFWQVLKVAVVTPLSPEKVRRDFSVLKRMLIQGKWGTKYWREFPFLETGAQASQIPPVGAGTA